MTARDPHLRWLKNAEHWKVYERFDERPEDLDPREVALGRSSNGTGEHEIIFLLKSKASHEARFYARGKGQIGPRHKHILAATCWAYGNGYLGVVVDPSDIFLQLACREEVLSGGVTADKHAVVTL